ncbi:ATP-binding protein [Arthrobacter roseus]|uniref:ATP-binding protein n=1 Tax=Arthrobacter roseus TaxID=136274 RepID=UPI0019659C6D|nr:ATP-binding protein [Arthrobacter roseus]MBM7849351.1 signal transduction histidine kinase/phage shock protein PspC (stress-responsive transcriptional regulator) [Arthrobacter roseus]
MQAPLVRPGNRVIAGVCSGLAAHLGFSVKATRVAMVALIFAGGAGALLYAWLWIMVPAVDGGTHEVGSPATARARRPLRFPGANAPGIDIDRIEARRRGTRELLIGVVLLLAAAMLLAYQLGADIRWGMILPLAAVALGSVIAWRQLDESRRSSLMNRAGAERKAGLLRVCGGLVLVIGGLLFMVSGAVAFDEIWSSLAASLAVLAGIALVLAPWGLNVWKDLESERSARVREAERADIAAHLHDSVLQTLALIQNRAGNEQDVMRLARAQERQLRDWLYRDNQDGQGNFSERIRSITAEMEDAYGHPIDVVIVGDASSTVSAALSPRTEALVLATREAVQNAAKHAGGQISVYVEAGTALEVFVRDRGVGFDPAAVPVDRLGIRESVIGRMRRHGGTVNIRSGPDGTEMHLVMSAGEKE